MSENVALFVMMRSFKDSPNPAYGIKIFPMLGVQAFPMWIVKNTNQLSNGEKVMQITWHNLSLKYTLTTEWTKILGVDYHPIFHDSE